jgi:hypothetical protein
MNYYRITIHNNTTKPMCSFYNRPDQGFSGAHKIVEDRSYLDPSEHEAVMISIKSPVILCAIYSEKTLSQKREK